MGRLAMIVREVCGVLGGEHTARRKQKTLPSAVEVLRLRSNSVTEVAELWGDFVPSARLLRADQNRCGLSWVSLTVPKLSLVEYELRADVRSSIAPDHQLFACRVITQTGEVSSGRTTFREGQPWLTDSVPVEARWEGQARVQAMVFDFEMAQNLARQITGDDRLALRVHAPAAVDKTASHRWATTFRYLTTALQLNPETSDDGDGSGIRPAGTSRAWATGLRRHALWATLACFSTSFTAALERTPQRSAAPRAVRQALAVIEEHAHLPITVDDIAQAVHMSTRGLHAAFRRSLDISPSEALRNTRLARAREDLLEASPSETVSAIARRWGFSHVTRFARTFEATFGEHPQAFLWRDHS